MKFNNANHKSNQSNPNNIALQKAIDNRSNQLNPNNPVYYQSRGITQVKKK